MGFISQSEAGRRALRLKYHIEKYDVPVVIQLRTGAGGNHWGIDSHLATMGHHIVSRPTQGKTPLYSLVRNGRGAAPGAPAVPGPLANNYGGFDMVARIITMGLANHPGSGGPVVANGHRIPKDNGRYYFMGWEFEGGLNAADWPPAYHEFMAKCLAGNLDYLDEMNAHTIDERSHFEHKGWAPNRKVDRLGYTEAIAREAIRKVRAGQSVGPAPIQEEEDMYDKLFISTDANGNKHHYGTLGPAHFTYVGNEPNYIKTREQLGREVTWWENAANDRTVADTSYFGQYVGPDSFRPKG